MTQHIEFDGFDVMSVVDFVERYAQRMDSITITKYSDRLYKLAVEYEYASTLDLVIVQPGDILIYDPAHQHFYSVPKRLIGGLT